MTARLLAERVAKLTAELRELLDQDSTEKWDVVLLPQSGYVRGQIIPARQNFPISLRPPKTGKNLPL